MLAGIAVAASLAARAQCVARLRETTADPQFFRDLGADLRRAVPRAQRGQGIEAFRRQRHVVGVHSACDLRKRGAQRFRDGGLTGAIGKSRSFSTFRGRTVLIADVVRTAFGVVDPAHAGERQIVVAGGLQRGGRGDVDGRDAGVEIGATASGQRRRLRLFARGRLLQHEGLAERRIVAGDRTAVGIDGVIVGITIIDIEQTQLRARAPIALRRRRHPVVDDARAFAVDHFQPRAGFGVEVGAAGERFGVRVVGPQQWDGKHCDREQGRGRQPSRHRGLRAEAHVEWGTIFCMKRPVLRRAVGVDRNPHGWSIE